MSLGKPLDGALSLPRGARPGGGEGGEPHAEIVATVWRSGGFLGDMAIHWNPGLNVLIGGRGTGKSTILESLRYALDLEPLGEDAKRAHEGIVRQVLKSGTKVQLLVRSPRPVAREYVIERTVPNPPVVKDLDGGVLDLVPADVLPRVEVYGQHEIAELARSPAKLTRLLDRFLPDPGDARDRREALRVELARNRHTVVEVHRELRRVDERLAALPALEETLARFQEAGLEEKLRERSLLVREEQLLKTAGERLRPIAAARAALVRALPLDRAFLAREALAELPGRDLLAEAEPVLRTLDAASADAASRLAAALAEAERHLGEIGERFQARRARVQEATEEVLRELQRTEVDGEEFIRLRQKLEELRPLNERRTALRGRLEELETERRQELDAWQDLLTATFRELERAAGRVGVQLERRVRVRLAFAGDRGPLFDLLRERVGGRLSETIDALARRQSLSLTDLVAACRGGREALIDRYELPPAQAERLALAEPEVLMEIEELELETTTEIELNVGTWDDAGAPADWQPLDRLSTGQKATAVLLLLLLESDAPLVVDQPEDDLDNRFIADGVVPKMRQEKLRRQFIFATHNANIPVIGDAELILGLTAAGEAGQGRASIPAEHRGSIDAPAVRELVEEVLEGGRKAFETRRLKYGF